MATLKRPSSPPILIHRLRQGVAALRPTRVDERQAIAAARLTPEQAAAFAALSAFDRRHLCRVLDGLRRAGVSDTDVLQAALLHDIGKQSPNGQVWLIHRALRVVLGRFASHLLERLARLPASRWRLGLALAVHHAALGAERAAALGCSPRTCWLIAHHEDHPAPADDALALLIACDEQTA